MSLSLGSKDIRYQILASALRCVEVAGEQAQTFLLCVLSNGRIDRTPHPNIAYIGGLMAVAL